MRDGVLYAPGLGYDLLVLQDFRKELLYSEYKIDYVDFKYDDAELCPSNYSCFNNKRNNWWIGISLGASLLYYCSAFVNHKPGRLTIINPFSDRKLLSTEKNFSLAGQWNFAPKNVLCEVQTLDLVVSVYDNSVPMYHGIELLNRARAKKKNLIFVNDGHKISNKQIQKELARCLLDLGSENHECQTYRNLYVYNEK